jgi:fructose-specific phosphotransferase system IIC component
VRVFSGVVFGYLFFELLWFELFHVTNTDPHAPASISFQLGAVIFGLLFALTAGFLASFIGGRPHFIAAWIAGGLIALTAVVIMIRFGAAWPQLMALLFMAPATVIGGWSYRLRLRAKADSENQE